MTKRKPGAVRGRPATGISPRVSVRIPQDWYDTIKAMPGKLSPNLKAVIHAGLLAMMHAENAQKQATSAQSGKKSKAKPN